MDHECKKEQIISEIQHQMVNNRDEIKKLILGNGEVGIIGRIQKLEIDMENFRKEMLKIKACLYAMISGIAYLIIEPLISKYIG